MFSNVSFPLNVFCTTYYQCFVSWRPVHNSTIYTEWTVRLSLTDCFIQIQLYMFSTVYCYVLALVWGQGQIQCISLQIMCFLPDISQNYDHISPDNKIWQAILARHPNSGKCIFCVVLVNCCRPWAASYNKTQHILPSMTSRKPSCFVNENWASYQHAQEGQSRFSSDKRCW